MEANPIQNRFFKPPHESTLADDDVRNQVLAELFDVRTRFADRLACAHVFDRERFEGLLLWLDTLRRCYAAAGLPMQESDFDQFSVIADYLKQEATYSRDQRAECIEAHTQWLGIMRRFNLISEGNS